jgi:hypothetical protein
MDLQLNTNKTVDLEKEPIITVTLSEFMNCGSRGRCSR